MPFQRAWDEGTGQFFIDRTQTGPPPPPDRGRVQSSDGTIVGDSSEINIPPPRPVPVKMPGPREKVLNADGTMNVRWWRFFQELHRRTGALEDNVNWADTQLGGTSTQGSITLTGVAPSAEIEHNRQTSATSLSISGAAPTVS